MIPNMNSNRTIGFMRTIGAILVYGALATAPEVVQAQLRKVPPVIPRLSQTHGPMIAYIISGLALVMITVVAFRSAHRRKP
jgi:hypothetical protein